MYNLLNITAPSTNKTQTAQQFGRVTHLDFVLQQAFFLMHFCKIIPINKRLVIQKNFALSLCSQLNYATFMLK